MEIYKEFAFESAHRLPNVPDGHKCGRMHGHSFKGTIYVDGKVGDKTGWVMDYADMKEIFQPIYDQLDHHCLNDVPGLENPTSENIARWIWNELRPCLPLLNAVEVAETCNARCVYRGD